MYVVHPDWLRPRNRGVLINCEGFTQVDVASPLEVLFLHPRVVSLTGGDPQGLFLNWAGGFSGFLQSIRPTEEFEGQNKSIKSRVRSTLLIWDTFAFDRVVDVSARVLLRLSPHASLYPSHLPYLLQTSFIQGDPAFEVGKVVPFRFSNKQSCRGSGSRDSENDASSIFEKAILLGIWLSRFGERCLFDF
ncbi:unnamed protein product [Malus baccata var. baccata]